MQKDMKQIYTDI